MIDQIAFFVRNIGIAVLPDPYIINIIGNVRKTDVNIYLADNESGSHYQKQ